MTQINNADIGFNTNGDLITTSGPGIFAPLSIGTNGQVLVADSTQPLGIKWDISTGPSTTWTPVVQGGTTTGTATYTLQQGVYLQLGVLVFVSGTISFNSFDGTGDLRVTLPAAVASSLAFASNGSILFDGTYSTATTDLFFFAQSGSSYGFIQATDSSNDVETIQCVAAANLQFSLIYETNP